MKQNLHYSEVCFTEGSKAVLILWVIVRYLCFVFVMFSCLFSAALWSPAGKGLPTGSLVFDVLLYFCLFPQWCPG